MFETCGSFLNIYVRFWVKRLISPILRFLFLDGDQAVKCFPAILFIQLNPNFNFSQTLSYFYISINHVKFIDINFPLLG